jgi:hypothetical protein
VLEELRADHASVRIYDGLRFNDERISDLARKALCAMSP